jgi:hypothetical protein
MPKYTKTSNKEVVSMGNHSMSHQENFWGTNIKEKLWEVIRTKQLSYPLRLRH